LASALATTLSDHSWRVSTCRIDVDADGGVERLFASTRRLLHDGRVSEKPTVLLLAGESIERRLVWALAVAGLRPALRLVTLARAARIPFDRSLYDLFAMSDLVVAESGIGVRAVRQCLAEAGIEPGPPVAAIPLPIAPSAERACSVEVRERLRRDQFDIEPADLLVGSMADSADDRRDRLAKRIFRILADGLYSSCTRCDAPAVDPAENGPPGMIARCRECGGKTRPGERWPRARLVLSPPRAKPGRPDCDERLVERLSCLDVHLAPHRFADVDPLLLSSCGLGVPVVTTKFGAAEELLAQAARLVAPSLTLDQPAGHRIALIDVAAAAVALVRLARDGEARSALGASARWAMRAHHRANVLRLWTDHCERLAAR
jgi:glycosyltransferase involved in cell wall biosynthesis